MTKEWNYNIILQTPIGKRYGTMSVMKIDETIQGILSLFGHAEPFVGTVKENGECRINGMIRSLMKRNEYTAHGRITSQKVELALEGKHKTLRIYGTPRIVEGGESIDGEIL